MKEQLEGGTLDDLVDETRNPYLRLVLGVALNKTSNYYKGELNK
jgi:hypothetical protein